MFERTRKRLTLLFGGILAVILIVVTVIYYLILQQTLQKNERIHLANVHDKMNRQWEHRVEEQRKTRGDKADGHETKNMEWAFLQSDELAVLVAPDGKTSASPTAFTAMGAQLLQWAQNRQYLGVQGDVFQLDDGGAKETFLASTNTLSLSGGTYWAAVNISDDLLLIGQMKLLLSVFSMVLLTVASVVGYFFAGKAIVPIKNSFFRQVEFTTNASHELRTPLSVIHSSVELLEECKEALPDFEQRVLTGLKDEVKRMIRLVESLLTLARSDAKVSVYRQEPVDLARIAAQAVQAMQTLARKKEIYLHMDLSHKEEAAVQIEGNEDQLRQLVLIVLDNAIKYTSAGGEVTVACHRGKHAGAVLQVTDTGIGMSREELPHIFERFYRVDKARSREFGGAGLGLSIAAEILRQHRASVHVESEAGKGSRFEFVFGS